MQFFFGFSYFIFSLFAAEPKSFFLEGLMKLEQRSHKCAEFNGKYVEKKYFFNPVTCRFLYKAKDLSAAIVVISELYSHTFSVDACAKASFWNT
jgi:hypothetical protein